MAKHKLDQLFAEKLEDFQPQPGDAAWEQIDTVLNRKTRRGFWSWAAVAASAIVAAFSLWYLLDSGASTTSHPEYAYASDEVSGIEVPIAIVYVPVFILTPAEEKIVPQRTPVINQPKPNKLEDTEPALRKNMALAVVQNTSEQIELPVDQVTEELPNEIAVNDVLMASAKVMDNQTEKQQLPVTIIYKKGEPQEESSFVKAVKHMEEIRLGERKLVDFSKLRANFKSKLKTNKDRTTK